MNDTGEIAGIVESKHRSIAEKAVFALSEQALDPLFWPAERVGAASAWWLHVPFAHWLVWAARPSVLVELGTHTGVSYSAFCHAVRLVRLPTRCHAVDTWRGDDHAGHYDDSVFQDFKGFHDQRFGQFSTLIRSTFDEALGFIEDGCIDILHIDGFHTYESVKHDFDSWLSKLSKSAVVLMHDINERSSDFGVWRLWAELCEQYPSFTFLHGHGLGVLAVGEQAPAAVLELCHMRDPTQVVAVRERFAQLGGRWLSETRERIAGQQVQDLVAQAGQVREAASAEVGQIRAELNGTREELAAVRSAAEQAHQALAQARREHAELSVTMEQLRHSSAQVQAERDELGNRVEELRRSLAAAGEDAAAKQAIADAQLVVADSKQAATERALRAAAEDNAALHRQVNETRAQLDAVARLKDAMERSTVWRASTPLRRAAGQLPPSLRRAVRGGIKLAWWTARLELLRKLKDRRALIRSYEQTSVSLQLPAAASPVPLSPEKHVDFGLTAALALSGKLRLVYISGEPETPGHVYRVERYAAAAEAAGARASVIGVEDIPGQLGLVESATILVLWRTPWCDKIALAIEAGRRSGTRIVFDLDDLMVDPELARVEIIDGIRSEFLSEDGVRSHYARVRRTVDAVDVCFATTDELALHLRRAGKPTFVLPNGFDRETHDVSQEAAMRWRRERQDKLIRIGYAGGTRTHQRDLGLAIEPLAQILRENADCRLVLFRTANGSPVIDVEEYPALAGLEQQIEWRPVQKLRSLPTELARFDINLAPLEFGNPFCESKSVLKFFEAALVQVPTVASPTGPFQRAIEHGRTGFLAATAEDWYQTLSRLVSDPALRDRVARAAYHASLAAFGPVQQELRFRRVITQLQGGPAGADAFALAAQTTSRSNVGPRSFESDLVFEHDRGQLARVSVVVPLYNYQQYIAEALESVHAQTLEPLDLVIVDDNSTDASLSVAREWVEGHASRFNRVVVLKNRENIGLAFSRNSGFSAARTRYVMLLDADNKLLPRCCEKLLERIEGTGAAFVYSVIQQFGSRANQINSLPWDPQHLVQGNYIDAMALVSKEAWAVVGGFDQPVRQGWEDYDFWCRLAERGLGGYWHPEVLALYRTHEASMMQTETLAGGNYRILHEDFMRRHPWVWLLHYHQAEKLPKPDPHLRESREQTRVDRLLGILRCPDTGTRLTWNENRTALVSLSGSRVWPLTEGRPVFTAHLIDPPVHPNTHISNELPEDALALVRETSGFVLNFCAGNSREKFEHVVEVGAAIFPPTDLVADAHVLPFYDDTFDAVIVMNTFEHYREPHTVVAELRRVLKPGGRILIRSAFMQPLHDKPWHFYNATRYGVEQWFKDFETEALQVPANLCPNHSLAWLASEAEAALRADVSAQAAREFAEAPVGQLVEIWRDPAQRADPLWTNFEQLSQPSQEAIAAGFQLIARKPLELPDFGRKRA